MLALADNALINDEQRRQDEKNSEDAHREALAQQEKARLKANKVQQLNAKWMAVHQHVDTVLDELKVRFDGEPICNLELLTVKSNQLAAVKGYLVESATLVDSMFDEDSKANGRDDEGGSC